MIKRIQTLLGECASARFSTLFRINYKSVAFALLLFLSLGNASVFSQGVSIAFSSGYVGTQASATQQTTNIKNLSTLGIVRVSFSQTYAGTFGGIQGNDLSGIIRLYLNTGQIISLTGSLNWRETTGNALDVFGLIFDLGQNATITYGTNQTYNIVGGSTNNTSTSLGLKAYASSVTFTDGSSRSGNAATSSIISDINSELATSPQPSTITLTNQSVIEGQNLVYTVTLSSATSAGRPQVYTFSTSGTAVKGSDYSATYTFSNGVVNNGDGTITVPGSVSSFTITINTIDDSLVENIENLFLSVGSKSALGSIADNDNVTGANCDPNSLYDNIISGYHQSIAKKSDGSFAVWGNIMGNNGAAHILSPQTINVTNYPALTGSILKSAVAGGASSSISQAIILTTDGLFAWGAEGAVLDNALTASTAFAKIVTPTGGDASTKLPTGVTPGSVKMMVAFYQTLVLVTNSGNVWVLTQSAGELRGVGSTSLAATTWSKVKIDALTDLTNVTAVRGMIHDGTYNALMALTANGKAYVWGKSVYLGNASAVTAKTYATQMTLPTEFNDTNLPKMIAVTGGNKTAPSTCKNTFYILSNSGALYALGDNQKKQIGDFTTLERTSWVRSKINSTTDFTDINYISAMESDPSDPAIVAITKSGTLYTWGFNPKNMIGRPTADISYDPGIPTGFTQGTDKAIFAEMGGHTLVYIKEGSTQFCYVGHRVNGSMGDGTTTDVSEVQFNCSGTPSLSVCGSVPVSASTITSTISANPTSISANGTSTSIITVQLKQANGTNLTSTGGAVVINTTKGTISSVTDNNDGTYTAILTSSSLSETASITYTLNGSNGTNSATVTFTALVPVISQTSAFSAFTTCVGTASAAQSFTVSASYLTNNLTVTAPTGFELSTASGGTYSPSIILTQSSGAVSSTTLWVRIKSATATSTTGNVVISSTGATSSNISITAQLNALPTISVNVIPDVTTSATSFTIPYTGLTGATLYSLAAGNSSMPSFIPVVDAAIGSSPLIIAIPASSQNSYDFILTAKNGTTGCSVQRTLSLVISDMNPGTTGSDQAICFGTAPAGFTNLTDASAGGAGSPTYVWQLSTNGVSGNFTDIPGSNSASYTHPTALTADTYFRRKATIGSAFATSHPIEVLVNPLPVISISPVSASITTGSNVTLTASGSSTYSWSPSTGLSASNTDVVVATPTVTTTYTVTGTNSPSACLSTSSITVTVNPALIAGTITSDQTVCAGIIAPAALTSTLDASGGTGSITYEWQYSLNGTTYNTISGEISSTFSPPVLSVNTYFRRGVSTANDATVYTSPVLITVQSSVGGSIAGSASYCEGPNSTVLNLSGQTGSITKWQSALAADFSGTVTDISNTSASITVTNLLASTYYRAVVTLGSCSAENSATASIEVNSLPVVSVSPSSASISAGTSVTLTASGASTYSWSPSAGLSASNTALVTATPTVTTTYTVTGVSASSCSSTANVTVTVNPALASGAISAAQTICVGATPATLTSSTDAAGGTGSIVYEWQSSTDGTTFTTISGATSSTYSPGAISINTYFRRGASTANDASVYSSAILITVQQSVGGSIAGSAKVCAGTNSSVLTLSGQTGSITKWQSSLTSNFASATDISNTTTTLTATNLSATTYYRAVITLGSCSAVNSSSTSLTVNALPSISVTPSSASITSGTSVTLTASGASTYSWSPSTSLSATNAAAVTATPTVTTTYTVTGTRSSCSSTATITVTVTPANNAPVDTDGDGVLDTTETSDNTDPNDGCSYLAASKTITPSAAWNALDCDGDGTPNGTDTDPKDPCVHVAGATPVTTNAIWRAADCDGDGVTNGKESDDGTDINSGCSYLLASRTLTPSAAWEALDCDADGNSNATDPNIDTPTASNDVVNIDNSGTATINVLVNDDFLPGLNTELTRQASPNEGTARGTVSFDPLTGVMTYKRAPFEYGLKTLGYKVTNKAANPPVSATAFVTILACDPADPLSDCDGDGELNGTDLAPTDPCVYEPTRQVKANVSDDWKALDCDGDGVLNGTELLDGTSASDACSFKATSITLAPSAAWLALDCDADGITNKVEGTQDFDGDGIPNCLDTDSDGDGISDKLETTVDTDKDGKPDYLDLDSDNDGILDYVENRACTGTGILCDTDADGVPNFRDLDSDGDKINDVIEATGSDYNGDGIADGNVDAKGIPSSANRGLTPPDTDRDGKLDPYDVDSDGDGILDYDEEYNEDADFADCDKDGIVNRLDPDECDIFSPQGISPNGDGKNDRLVFKGLFLRKIPNRLSVFNRWGTLVFEMESYDNSFTGTLLPDGTYYYVLDFFGKKPTISNYLSVDRTIK